MLISTMNDVPAIELPESGHVARDGRGRLRGRAKATA